MNHLRAVIPEVIYQYTSSSSGQIVPSRPSIRVRARLSLFFVVEQVVHKVAHKKQYYSQRPDLRNQIELALYLHELWNSAVDDPLGNTRPLALPAEITPAPLPAQRAYTNALPNGRITSHGSGNSSVWQRTIDHQEHRGQAVDEWLEQLESSTLCAPCKDTIEWQDGNMERSPGLTQSGSSKDSLDTDHASATSVPNNLIKPVWSGTCDENVARALEQVGDKVFLQAEMERREGEMKRMDPILAYQLEQQEKRDSRAKAKRARHRNGTH